MLLWYKIVIFHGFIKLLLYVKRIYEWIEIYFPKTRKNGLFTLIIFVLQYNALE